MSTLDAGALLLVVVAALSYVNHRYVRLPPAMGLLLGSLLISLAIIGLGRLGVPVIGFAQRTLARMDFDATLMKGMLGFLLFAGARSFDSGRVFP